MKTRFSLWLAVVLLLVVVLLTPAVWTKQTQRGGSMAQTWEYKSLVLVIDGRNTTLHEDGKLVPGSATPVTRAPELGAQGWELVSVTAAVSRSSPT